MFDACSTLRFFGYRPVALEGVRAARNPVLYHVVVFAGLGCLLAGYVPLEQFILRVCVWVCWFVCLLACFEPEITLYLKGTLKLRCVSFHERNP